MTIPQSEIDLSKSKFIVERLTKANHELEKLDAFLKGIKLGREMTLAEVDKK